MPSKAGYSWASAFPTCSPNNVSRGFDRNGPGCLPTFFVWTRKRVTALGSRKEPCPGPPKHKGPSTPNALQNRPLSSAKCCAVFNPNRRAFLCRGLWSVGLSCTPTCSAISPRVTGPRRADEATPTGISLTHQLALCRGRFSCKSNL
jgi:hypothetical protein